jgi:periplasmic protein TonB
MASPAEIAQTPPETPEIPETLPADFSGWDGGDLEAALAAEPSDFEPPVDYDVIFKPAAQPARLQAVPSPVWKDERGTSTPPSLLPAAFFAEVEAPFEPPPVEMVFGARQHFIETEPETETTNQSKVKLISIIIAVSSALLLISLTPFLYPKLRAWTAPAKHAVAPRTTTISVAAPPSPTQPTAKPQPVQQTATEQQVAPHVESEMMNNQLNAPAVIPRNVKTAAVDEPPPSSGFGSMEGLGATGSGATGGVFAGSGHPNVKVESARKMEISAGVAVGLLIQKTAPVYPSIAKSAHVAGTVVLQATISKTGSIQDLHVVSGPPLLRQSAVNAVKTWRYKPYLLNNEPVDVDTTISVIFNLAG